MARAVIVALARSPCLLSLACPPGAVTRAGLTKQGQLQFAGVPPTPEEGLTGEIVYVATGTAAEYEGLDVTGKIVLISVTARQRRSEPK